MTTPADSLLTKTEAELRLITQRPEAHPPGLVAAAQQELRRRGDLTPLPAPTDDYDSYAAAPSSRLGLILGGLGLALLLALGLLWYQHRVTPAAQAPKRAASPDSFKLETAVATPLPNFDVESPILRQLALLPPAERTTSGLAMQHYQALTRRFWLAQYSSDYLIKQAQTGHPNAPVFSQQLATTQSHWEVLRAGFGRGEQFPPAMTDHLARMAQVERYQHDALLDLQADCENQRPPHLDAPALAAQQQVKQALAPLLRKPGPLTVHLQ